MKQKWFYQMQDQAKTYILANYGAHSDISCNWQHVGKDIVNENFKVITDNKTYFIHVIMNKREVIAVYEMKGCFHS